MTNIVIDRPDPNLATSSASLKMTELIGRPSRRGTAFRRILGALASLARKGQRADCGLFRRAEDVGAISSRTQIANMAQIKPERPQMRDTNTAAIAPSERCQAASRHNVPIGRTCTCRLAYSNGSSLEVGLPLSVASLPKIVDVLEVDGAPRYIVLNYCDFVQLSNSLREPHVPDVASVLDVAGKHSFVVLGYQKFALSLLNTEIAGDIDEQAYLTQHTDVAASIVRGSHRCAKEHYIVQGYLERRIVQFPKGNLAKRAG